MKAVGIVDTSILLSILQVPGRDERSTEVLQELEQRKTQGHSLLLPLAALIETGNHIGRLSDGRQRRQTAQRFVNVVEAALEGKAPFTPVDDVEVEHVRQWCREYVEWVTPKGRELADLSIKQTWVRQCELHLGRRVYIWSLDEHLDSFDREAVI